MKAGEQSSMLHQNWAFKDILPGKEVGKSMRGQPVRQERAGQVCTGSMYVVSTQAKQTMVISSMALHGGLTRF